MNIQRCENSQATELFAWFAENSSVIRSLSLFTHGLDKVFLVNYFWLIISYQISRIVKLEETGIKARSRYTDCNRNGSCSLRGDPEIITGENEPKCQASALFNRL